MQISQKAIDLIIREEVSSEAYYRKHYTHTEWPGGASGVTIGIGYDLGYQTAAKIKADWGTRVDPLMLAAMVECVGVKGSDAKSLSARMNNRITIPWEAAMAVFMNRDLPQWIAATLHALPHCDLLSPTCLGVLVSLNYNRGTGGYTAPGDRYTEMRAIRSAMANETFGTIPALLDQMARLWTSGVAGRRHREAALFREGLKEPMGQPPVTPPALDPHVTTPIRPDSPARTKPPATTNAQNSTTSAIIVGGSVAAQQAQAQGLISIETAIVLAATCIVGGAITWTLWYRNRNPS